MYATLLAPASGCIFIGICVPWVRFRDPRLIAWTPPASDSRGSYSAVVFLSLTTVNGKLAEPSITHSVG